MSQDTNSGEVVWLKITAKDERRLLEFLDTIIDESTFEEIGVTVEKFPCDAVKLQATEKEKKIKKQFYRKEYVTRPHVIAKKQERANDPVIQEKLREYSKREEVKKRKKIMADAKRRENKLIREMAPQIAAEASKKAREPFKEILELTKIKRKRSEKNPKPARQVKKRKLSQSVAEVPTV